MDNVLNDDLYLGINEKTLAGLCLEIEACSDNIATIFDQIDDSMNELSSYYKSSSLDSIINSYNEFRKNYEIIKNNINSYSADLNDLVIKYKNGAKGVILSIDQKSDDVRSILKTIDDRMEN